MPIKPEPEAPAPPPKKAPKRRWLKLLLSAGLLISILTGAVAAYIINMDLPDVTALEDYQPPAISRVLGADHKVVHQFAQQKRTVVALSAMSPLLQKAVISVEDANFYKHVGLDPWAIFRAVLRDVKERRFAEGGSTLTQQLTRKLFLTDDKLMRRKIQEAMLAMQIEKTYTKDEILALYLNQIYMGHGRYGMEAAAQFYFGVSAADLSLPQAATLAGIIQRPEDQSPYRNPRRSMQRRNHVLERMAIEGYITREAAEDAKKALVVVGAGEREESPALYFAEEIRKSITRKYGDDTLMRGGLVIQTGLDLPLQASAQKALSQGLRDLDKRRGFRRPKHNILLEKSGSLESYKTHDWDQSVQQGDLVTGLVMKVTPRQATIRVGRRTASISPADAAWTGRDDLTWILRPGDLALFEVAKATDERLSLVLDQEPEVEGAVLALDPRTGDMRAMVGGYDFNRSQFNRATQAQRQCGSAFKPFIYAQAIEEGRTPSDLLFDAPTVFIDQQTGVKYQPENYERRYEGVVTMRRALEESINVPTVTLLNQIGYQRTVDFARRFGITSRLYPYPSLALGTSEVSLLELTAAYGVFASGGLLSTPRLISQVTDREGNILESTHSVSNEVMRADVAAVMVSMMRGVVERGTAATAARQGVQLAGKTGTTDDYTDAWFIGYAPSLVLGVWVGNDKKVSLGPRETGARAALPIWSAIMDDYLKGHPAEEFPANPGVVTLDVDHESGLRSSAQAGCHVVITESFLKGTEIEHSCTPGAHNRLRLPYYLQRYPTTEEGRVRIPDEEIDRLLLENPFQLELAGRTILNALTPHGMEMVPLARSGGGRPQDLSWNFFGQGAEGGDHPNAPYSDAEELAWAQLLPAELPPIMTGPEIFLGIDGRTAAVINVRYP